MKKRTLPKYKKGGDLPKLKDNIQTNKSDNTKTNYAPVRPRGYTPDSWATNINEIQPNGRVNPNIPGLEDASLEVIDAIGLINPLYAGLGGLAGLAGTSGEILIKKIMQKKALNQALSAAEKEYLHTVRTVGYSFAPKNMDNLPLLEKSFSKAQSLSDETFEKLTGFSKEKIQNKINDLKANSSKVKVGEDEVSPLLDRYTPRVNPRVQELRRNLDEVDVYNQLAPPPSEIIIPDNIPRFNLDDINNYDNVIDEMVLNNTRRFSQEMQSPTQNREMFSKTKRVTRNSFDVGSGIANKLFNSSYKPISYPKNTQSLIGSLGRDNDVVSDLRQALKTVNNAPSGSSFIGSGSLSTDSYPLTARAMSKMISEGKGSVNFAGESSLNTLGFNSIIDGNPNINLKEINGIINDINKVSKTKIPFAKKVTDKNGYYLTAPDLIFTKYSNGGQIMKKRSLKKYNNGGMAKDLTSTAANLAVPGLGLALGAVDSMTTNPDGSPKDGIAGFASRINPLSNIGRIADGKDVGRSLLNLTPFGAAFEATGLNDRMFGQSDYTIEADRLKRQEQSKELTQRRLGTMNSPMTGISTNNNNMYPHGGIVNQDQDGAIAELELQEQMQLPDGTVMGVDGPSHEQGGIEVNVPEGTKVFSDRLKNGKRTFAQHAKTINNKISKLDKKPDSQAKSNTEMLFNQQLDNLFNTQEEMKAIKEETKQRRMFAKGGVIPKNNMKLSNEEVKNFTDNFGNYGNLNSYYTLSPQDKMRIDLDMQRRKGTTIDEIFKNNNLAELTNNRDSSEYLSSYQTGYNMGNNYPVAVETVYKQGTDLNNSSDPSYSGRYKGYFNNPKVKQRTFAKGGTIPPSHNGMYPAHNIRIMRHGGLTHYDGENGNGVIFNDPSVVITDPLAQYKWGMENKNSNLFPSQPKQIVTEDYGVQRPSVTKGTQSFRQSESNNINSNYFTPQMMGYATQGITNAMQNQQINSVKTPRTIKDVSFSAGRRPGYVDYSAERAAIDAETAGARRGLNLGSGSYSTQAANLQKIRNAQLAGKGRSFQTERNTNTQLDNAYNSAQAAAYNQGVQANLGIDQYNLENAYNFDLWKAGNKMKSTGSMGDNVTNMFNNQISKDNQMAYWNVMKNMFEKKVAADTGMPDGKKKYGGTVKRSLRK
jgi:hypothetical protein